MNRTLVNRNLGKEKLWEYLDSVFKAHPKGAEVIIRDNIHGNYVMYYRKLNGVKVDDSGGLWEI